jgi:hypothetical protein
VNISDALPRYRKKSTWVSIILVEKIPFPAGKLQRSSPQLFFTVQRKGSGNFSCIAIADKSERYIILSSPGGLFTSFYK